MRPRKAKLKPFRDPVTPPLNTMPIVVTIDQVSSGVRKMLERNPDWNSTLGVTTLLLERLEQMRIEALERSKIISIALNVGDWDRIRLEADAICEATTVNDWNAGPVHGISVRRFRP